MIIKLIMGLIISLLMSFNSGQGMMVAEGSGFFINQDGYIATAAHVVDAIAEIHGVMLVQYQNVWYIATVIDEDKDSDVAIVHINVKNEFSFVLNIAEMKGIGYTIGYPATTDKLTVVVGVLGRDDGMVSIFNAKNFVTCGGNSGGVLIDSEGRALGVVDISLTSRAVDKCGYTGLASDINNVIALASRNNILLGASEQELSKNTKDIINNILNKNGVVRIMIVPPELLKRK